MTFILSPPHYRVRRRGGEPLPARLTIDNELPGFSGTPQQADVGLLEIDLTATDRSGAAVLDRFMIVVQPAETVPNVISGNNGSDILVGTDGVDWGDGSRGDDRDTIVESAITDPIEPTATPELGSIGFGEDIAPEQLWFERQGDALVVSIIGTRDEVQIADWYLGQDYQIEEFHTADGSVLLNTRIDQPVFAMASLAEPHIGELSLPMDYQEELHRVITQVRQAA
jgi:hypothetical protein